MKKLTALLLCGLLALLPALALAEEPFDEFFNLFADERSGEAEPRENSGSGETLTLNVNGETVVLNYDDSPLYSSIQGGTVQASYYAYGADGVTLYELYICFPATVRSGMVITPEYGALTGEDCSVSLIVSTNSVDQVYYFSSLSQGAVYPTDSSFTISIDDVVEGVGAATYSGRLSATLVALDMSSGDSVATLSIPETPFRFTVGGASQDRDNPVPVPTPMPNDLRKV